MPPLDYPALLFGLYGLVLGSFSNVVIYRLPAGLSTVYPASRCPRCLAPIRPRHNVPVLGWIVLGGRCHDCGNPISPRYPLVEATTGMLFVLSWRQFDSLPQVLLAAAFASAVLVLGLIDLDHRGLPDSITRSTLVLGLVAGPVVGWLSWREAILAAALGWLLAEVPSFFWRKWRGEPGFGAGDGRMLAAMGPFLGVERLISTFVLALVLAAMVSMLALLAGAILARWPGCGNLLGRGALWRSAAYGRTARGRYGDTLPFGTILAVAALFVFFVGANLPSLGSAIPTERAGILLVDEVIRGEIRRAPISAPGPSSVAGPPFALPPSPPGRDRKS